MTFSATGRDFIVELGARLAALRKARTNPKWQQQQMELITTLPRAKQQMLDGLLAGSAAACRTPCAPPSSSTLLPLELVTHRVKVLRGQRVMVDADLAALYGVETKRFNESVKRNAEKFPVDFIFQLTAEEFAALRSQCATSNESSTPNATGRSGRCYAPQVFTEHGALMAATILNSPRAVEVSVYVVRAFAQLRELANTHQGLAKRLDALKDKTEALAMSHDTFSRNTRNQLKQIFEALREGRTGGTSASATAQAAYRVHHARRHERQAQGQCQGHQQEGVARHHSAAKRRSHRNPTALATGRGCRWLFCFD